MLDISLRFIGDAMLFCVLDVEDELEDVPVELKTWAQQIRCFFNRKLFPAFEKTLRAKVSAY